MMNKYNKDRLIIFITLIILLGGFSVYLAMHTEATPTSVKKTSRLSTPDTLGLQLTPPPTPMATPTPTPTPTSTPTPTPTPTPRATQVPVGSGNFTTLSPGSPLPSDG